MPKITTIDFNLYVKIKGEVEDDTKDQRELDNFLVDLARKYNKPDLYFIGVDLYPDLK